MNSTPDSNFLTYPRGLKSWLFTLDHKRIGVLYLAGVTASFLLGGIFAVLIRIQLLHPNGGGIMGPQTYNQMFTLHGAIMIFLFIIPGIPVSFGNFVLPLLIGAKDVAFPRLNLASWYIYVTGAIMAIVAMVTGSVDTGWTFYTPYSTTTGGAVVMMTMAVFVLGFSSIFTGLNFVVTIHKLRAPGLTWFRLPCRRACLPWRWLTTTAWLARSNSTRLPGAKNTSANWPRICARATRNPPTIFCTPRGTIA